MVESEDSGDLENKINGVLEEIESDYYGEERPYDVDVKYRFAILEDPVTEFHTAMLVLKYQE